MTEVWNPKALCPICGRRYEEHSWNKAEKVSRKAAPPSSEAKEETLRDVSREIRSLTYDSAHKEK